MVDVSHSPLLFLDVLQVSRCYTLLYSYYNITFRISQDIDIFEYEYCAGFASGQYFLYRQEWPQTSELARNSYETQVFPKNICFYIEQFRCLHLSKLN